MNAKNGKAKEKSPRAKALPEIEQLQTHIAHLESRLRAQRHQITNLQGALRERNVRMDNWYRGRDALLREIARDAQSSAYGWKGEAESMRRRLREMEEAPPEAAR